MYQLIIALIMIIHTPETEVIYKFSKQHTIQDWYVIDDGVMGGLSQGKININDEGIGVYSGNVTTENNGGFSSLRYRFDRKKVDKYKGVALRVRGDGKLYQFRIKTNKNHRYSYVAYFETSNDWETVIIPFNAFSPRFRGYPINKPSYPGEYMEEVAFLIGNKVIESFKLEIDSITLIE